MLTAQHSTALLTKKKTKEERKSECRDLCGEGDTGQPLEGKFCPTSRVDTRGFVPGKLGLRAQLSALEKWTIGPHGSTVSGPVVLLENGTDRVSAWVKCRTTSVA